VGDEVQVKKLRVRHVGLTLGRCLRVEGG
jgi:hypothetical protein